QAEDGIRDPLVTEFRRVLFRSIPTAPRKSVRRSIPLPPSSARRAVGSRKSLQKLRRHASWQRRTGAIAASLKAADEAGPARGTRSEERRVGKGARARRADHPKD